MRNQVDFKRPPDELFHNPVRDGGLYFLEEPEFIWRPYPAAVIKGFATSEHDEVQQRISQFLDVTHRHKTFSEAIVFNSTPVLLHKARFKKSFVTVNDKCLLGGAAGVRLLNRYVWENEDQGGDPDAMLADYFDLCQALNRDAVLPLARSAPDPGLPFAIECRNTFNYFHFVTESLCQLCLAADSGHTGPIYMHFPNQTDKTRDFTRRYIEAIFPDLAPRVIFQRTPFDHEQVIGTYNFQTSYYLFPEAAFGSVDRLAPSNVYWKKRRATRGSQAILAMNSIDHSLLRLRERALAAIEGRDFSYLPRRFWITRDPGLARKRTMQGEAEVMEMLALFGFEAVTFENLDPMEQIALMANAEMMVSYHGAGFANMLFANQTAWIVEIGTHQTAELRWGDFWRLANAAGCRYVSFFADYAKPDPLTEPSFKQDGLVPVALSRKGLAEIMSFIVSVLGHVPQLSRKADVLRLTEKLVATGAAEQALVVLRRHGAADSGDADLLLAMAEAFKALGWEAERLRYLHAAFAADPGRWNLLIQIVWAARSLGHNDAMCTALEVLRDAFPDRFEAFTRDRPWMRSQVA